MLQRVKVYRLNDDGKWDDQGTGHVTVDYLEVTIKKRLARTWYLLLSLGKNLIYEYPHIWNLGSMKQRSEEPGLLVTDEDEHETLLLHRISADDIYRKQEGILKCS